MSSAPVPVPRRLAAEFPGSGFPAAIVTGSGIAAQWPSPSDTGLQLLENAAATAAGLLAVILMSGPVPGAHFNPMASFADASLGGMSWREATAYPPAQVAGCVTGAVAANLMSALPAVSVSARHRASGAQALAEGIATAGLVLVIFALGRSSRPGSAPAAVGGYTGAACWFTSSTSFANPAITVGRMFPAASAGIAKRTVLAAIHHGMTIGATSDPDLSRTPRLGSPLGRRPGRCPSLDPPATAGGRHGEVTTGGKGKEPS